jgi:phosphomevalonate kinase
MTILILADVDAGSNTPSMVGKVLAWRKANPESGRSLSCLPFFDHLGSSHARPKPPALTLWTEIDELNKSLAGVFEALSKDYAEDESSYMASFSELVKQNSHEWQATDSTSRLLVAARDTITVCLVPWVRDRGSPDVCVPPPIPFFRISGLG